MDLEKSMRIAELPESVRVVLRDLLARGDRISARELLRILAELLATAGAYRFYIMAILSEMAMIGRLNLAALMEALTLLNAGEGIFTAVGAEAAGAGAAGLTGAAAAAAVAIGVLIVAATAYLAYDLEKRVKIRHPPMGVPCVPLSGPTGSVQKLSRSRIGSLTSLNKALAAAQADAEATVTCSKTGCGNGRRCAPVANIINALPKYRVFWTTTDVTYMVGCACI